MTNIELMEKALPTAPLKIAALESCKDLAEKVDQYIVSFRKNSRLPLLLNFSEIIFHSEILYD